MTRKIKKLNWWIQSKISSFFYPIDDSLTYIGVTGTDGKTSTCNFLYEIGKEHGFAVLMITTVGAKFYFNGKEENVDFKLHSTSYISFVFKHFIKNIRSGNIIEAFTPTYKKYDEYTAEYHRTTPLAHEIRQMIRKYIDRGANMIILESTSHALDQYRIADIKFDVAVYTNITHEHLDYHGTYENYVGAKARLMSMLKDDGFVVLNKTDQSYEYLIHYVKKYKVRHIDYEFDNYEDMDPKNFWVNFYQSHVVISKNKDKKAKNSINVSLNIDGKYNIFNAGAAATAFYYYFDKKPEYISKGLSKLKTISGRMNVLSKNPDIIVDFAHTPNAMKVILQEVKQKTKGKLWVVFGCAGLRDVEKRYLMGEIAGKYADCILVTAEDPRTERLEDINDQIIKNGILKNRDIRYRILRYRVNMDLSTDMEEKLVIRFDKDDITSRTDAIKLAITKAEKDDIVLILGKGHEKTMCFGETEVPYNDIEFVSKLIKKEFVD